MANTGRNWGGEPGGVWGPFSALMRSSDGPLAIGDTGGGFSRTLVKNLNGEQVWEYRPDPKLGDFTLSHAVGARVTPGEQPSLVLVGATDRDTRRARLLLVHAGARTIYDEILEMVPRVMTTRRGDGSDVLFIADGAGIRALRPIHLSK